MKSFLNKNINNPILLCLLVLSIQTESLEAEIELLDRVVAVVESSVIMESELNLRVKDIIGRLRNEGTELPPQKVLEEQVLERLIIEEIQLQIGERAGVKISDEELNRAISMIASENSMSLEQFKENIEAGNQTYSNLRDSVRKELIIQRVQRGKVGANIEISEQEIENFLNSQEGKSRLAEQYNVEQILLSLNSGATEEEVKQVEKEALDIIDKYSNGESFKKMAATFSSGQNALEGGSLGWRRASELPSLFSEIVQKMKIKEISEPIRSGAGFHIIRLADKKGDVVKFEDQTLVRHILIKPSEIRTEKQAEELIESIHVRVEAGESFKQLARQYSEDPGSKMEGGDLGWNTLGTFDPTFEAVMKSLEIGGLSRPFKSSF